MTAVNSLRMTVSKTTWQVANPAFHVRRAEGRSKAGRKGRAVQHAVPHCAIIRPSAVNATIRPAPSGGVENVSSISTNTQARLSVDYDAGRSDFGTTVAISNRVEISDPSGLFPRPASIPKPHFPQHIPQSRRPQAAGFFSFPAGRREQRWLGIYVARRSIILHAGFRRSRNVSAPTPDCFREACRGDFMTKEDAHSLAACWRRRGGATRRRSTGWSAGCGPTARPWRKRGSAPTCPSNRRTRTSPRTPPSASASNSRRFEGRPRASWLPGSAASRAAPPSIGSGRMGCRCPNPARRNRPPRSRPWSSSTTRRRSCTVLAALEGMPERRRQVVEMRLIDRLPHAKIAERLGASEAATRVLFYRAWGSSRIVEEDRT